MDRYAHKYIYIYIYMYTNAYSNMDTNVHTVATLTPEIRVRGLFLRLKYACVDCSYAGNMLVLTVLTPEICLC